MNDTAKQIIDALRPLADKIGSGAEHLYRVYVRQSYIDGITLIVFGILLALVTLVVHRFVIRYMKAPENKPDSYQISVSSRELIAGGFLFVALFVAAIVVMFGAQQLLNPEYRAIQNLLQSIRGGQ